MNHIGRSFMIMAIIVLVVIGLSSTEMGRVVMAGLSTAVSSMMGR